MTTTIKITYGGETVTLTANLVEASAALLVDGNPIGRQTADARHRTADAVRLACIATWPEAGREAWDEGGEAWDAMAYEPADAADMTSTDDTEPTIVLAFERSDTDEHGNINYDVTMTVDGREVIGQITLAADRINGGRLVPVGDSIDCWIGDTIQHELVSLPGGARGPLGRALIGALSTRDAGTVRA